MWVATKVFGGNDFPPIHRNTYEELLEAIKAFKDFYYPLCTLTNEGDRMTLASVKPGKYRKLVRTIMLIKLEEVHTHEDVSTPLD